MTLKNIFASLCVVVVLLLTACGGEKHTKKAQLLDKDGNYDRIDRRGKELFGAQENFCKEAVAKTKSLEEEPLQERVFVPATPHEGIE